MYWWHIKLLIINSFTTKEYFFVFSISIQKCNFENLSYNYYYTYFLLEYIFRYYHKFILSLKFQLAKNHF